ncbi:germ cell-less protein-like 1 [Actinia tenebrosa]|uniref:Germ cell-less protein-like 1 n=1 Tax=Actinia tenebrosa TaxID=6105 RepID=A0A6P8IGQ9_ACTTE|nr:germ cell-less protein-like 1 [Actinia tenebrosa]
MFSGQWKESMEDFISIQIPDEIITVEAMDTALGSLYRDEVTVSQTEVIPLLAVACLLQLESLSSQCAEFMQDTINNHTVCEYISAARQYGETEVEKKCLEWLERRLTSSWTVALLKEISTELMEQVIKSPGLFVMQIEIDVYTLLVIWMYLKLHPLWQGTNKDLRVQSTDYFRSKSQENSQAFLESHEGIVFAPAFKGLRLIHVVNDIRSMIMLQSDNIIPTGWFSPVYKEQWRKMLFVYQNLDHGPPEDMTLEHFNLSAHRYGRILEKSMKYCWRWTGFLYGLDIIVMYNNRTRQLSLRRNTYIHPTHGIICVQRQHSFMVKVDIASFHSNGSEKYHKTSGLKHLALGLDEEVRILQVDKHVAYPMYISAHIALVNVPLDKQQATE